ncbi:MAG: M14 family zinc carboxypeptidase, partial [Gammaproteobacteria bacterium]|nr:M14 family zinc carboxypeptidase [Gammaproteobacteria bacterium]
MKGVRALPPILAVVLAAGFASPVDGASAAAGTDDLRTLAEQTGFKRTGRYDEVERLCRAFADRWPTRVRCVEFGRTPEQRPMLALVASEDGVLDAATARARARPVVLFQGGIHAGEIDGKDAGFLALREMLEGRVNRGMLARTTVVFVPVFNVDGHERFGAWNRPNQRGPEEMGWRTTAQN